MFIRKSSAYFGKTNLFLCFIYQQLIAENEKVRVKDSGVGFIDSAGLEQLLWVRDWCNENKCELRLAGLDENCARILEITRLAGEFDCYAELAKAVKSFA